MKIRMVMYLVIWLVAACGEHDLSGGGNGSGDAKRNVNNQEVDVAEGEGGINTEQELYAFDPETVFGNSPEESALKACFREWGQTPFSETTARNFKTLTSSSVGFGSKNISDRATTKEPALFLVKASSTGFGDINLDLGNKNGWYCLQTSSVGFGSVSINKHCKATLGNHQHDSTGFGNSNTMEYGEDC